MDNKISIKYTMRMLTFIVFISGATGNILSELQIRGSMNHEQMTEVFEKPWRQQRHGTELTKMDKEFLAKLDREAASAPLRPKNSGARLRKEYHCLDRTERHQLHDSMKKMKDTMVGLNSEYDTFVLHHDGSRSPSAHQGPSFIIWHRMFLFIMEKAMQKYHANAAMAYWDNRLLRRTGVHPKYSVLFSPEMAGSSEGDVDVGPFANWTISSDSCKKISTILSRNVTDSSYLYGDFLSKEFRVFKTFKDICTPWNPAFEYLHGQIHLFIGGQMGEVMCAPYDPLFYLHHAFIDYLYEQHIRRPIVRLKHALAYPDTANTVLDKFYNATYRMLPFGIRHYQMLNSPKFVPGYHKSPGDVVCSTDADCCPNGAAWHVWCDASTRLCVSKVVEGAPASIAKACYCANNKPAVVGGLCACV